MRNNKVNVVFILPSLNPGGAERVMSFVAQNLDKQEFNTSLWVISKPFENDYPIKDIEVKYFGKSRVLKSVFPLIKNIILEKPDIIISSIGHLNQMMGLISILFPKTKFIGREANVLSVLSQFHTKKSYGHRLFRFSYLSLDKILCTSKDMVNDFKQVYGFPDDKLALINNPISHKFNGQKITKNDCVPIQFITVGSLKKQKGHERILKALSKLNFDFNYTMIGDGNERKKIMALVKELKLDNKITHIPYTKKVDEHLSSSDLFLQGAYVEGFPNCLLESAATGLPIVAFNAVGGLNEIVEVGKNGYIAQNENEFVSLVHKSIFEKNWDYQEISRNTHKKYGAEKILNKYETLFKTMVN
ncbi:glycosyltransferase [Flagellimonas nanhaiensis]|uniref:Glycosyltransferase n=1 Tax=Flagellimonas nanhaiensis TaxID=2292706 RepID=A0A371JKV9_9FLAO|nr:glycosyltransferase [Allomuricauda nanhaiensis]RDY57593.1 glycosyltransferase [Allomuricauda nanhaiensis]